MADVSVRAKIPKLTSDDLGGPDRVRHIQLRRVAEAASFQRRRDAQSGRVEARLTV